MNHAPSRATCLVIALVLCAVLSEQHTGTTRSVVAQAQSTPTLVPSADGTAVYDETNNVTWLADADLPASNQFGVPLCASGRSQICINSSGSMRYDAAVAWVAAMNAAAYLGHTNWQLPTTPPKDPSCAKIGANTDTFGFGCTGSPLGSLYSRLGFAAPNSVQPAANQLAGPFSNLQPYLYWSRTPGGGATDACASAANGCGMASFSFNTGFHGANTLANFLYLWPSVPGSLTGAPASTGAALQVGADGQTVFDPESDRTWLTDADLAASNQFGLPACADPTTPPECVAQGGAMTFAAAEQFIAYMNAAAYLGQTNWEIPPLEAGCPAYGCGGGKDPMGNLYQQLGLSAGHPAVAAPNNPVGPFQNLQAYLYWSCEGQAIHGGCAANGPVPNQQWSFSFGSDFTGTDILQNSLYVTAYYPGAGPTTAATSSPTP
jgi:hypothetical protein